MIDRARDFMAVDILEGRKLDLRVRIDAEQDGYLVATWAFSDAVKSCSDAAPIGRTKHAGPISISTR